MQLVKWIILRTSNMKDEMIHKFFAFIQVRHDIYLRKTKGLPKPWTDVEILQEYKFCNVFRELDSVTIWIDKNIRQRWANHKYLWFALCVARRINLPVTLEHLDELLVDWDADKTYSILEERKSSGLPIYNSAYSLTTASRKMDKNTYTVYECLDKLWEKREEITRWLRWDSWDSLERTFGKFEKGNPGISGFLAYEIVTDLRHTRYLRNARDIMSWANAGPGAIRGLNRIYDKPLTRKINACQANKDMQKLLSLAELYMSDRFPKMEMRDIEHCLCEFDKYMRIKLGKSFLCRKYNGKGE